MAGFVHKIWFICLIVQLLPDELLPRVQDKHERLAQAHGHGDALHLMPVKTALIHLIGGAGLFKMDGTLALMSGVQ